MARVQIQTTGEEQWAEMATEDRDKLRLLAEQLKTPEISELETGKKLVEASAICEKYRAFLRFLDQLPFTKRTAYRRIRMYERAIEMWPYEVVQRAIARRIPMIGVTAEKPMGAYEDIDVPFERSTDWHEESVEFPNPPPTTQDINEFLIQAELEVRRGKAKKRDPRVLLKECFKTMEQSARHMVDLDERQKFMTDLIGLTMTLFTGADAPETFSPCEIPEEFWTNSAGRYPRTPEIRDRFRAAANARWMNEFLGGKNK
jgi:hypothetical protein